MALCFRNGGSQTPDCWLKLARNTQEIVFQVENQSMVSIEVCVNKIFVNGKRLKIININGIEFDEDFDFCLGEFEAGKKEFPYVVVKKGSSRIKCQNEEIEHIEISIDAYNHGNSIYCHSKKIEILCNAKVNDSNLTWIKA